MKNLLCACALMFTLTVFSQARKIAAEKYPSLLWEITGTGLSKPSYLFGTMHVSSKMVFHLSDSFYLALRNAQVVALETNPGTWQEDFSKYDMEGVSAEAGRYYAGRNLNQVPQDYLTLSRLKLLPYEKSMEAALYSSPSLINSFLYRSNAESGADFEEDTYLDLHIFQAGRKLGKKVCGVEDFHGSMQLVKEAYADAAKEKKKERSFDYDDDFSFARLEEAYRTGNLDLLDTINKLNSQSAAFDEKFLYKRNDIQAASIDSILKTGATLFVGVGAAHLPGERGVIEILRRAGYRLRPIRMRERDSRHKESIEKIRVPVQFSQQVAEDGFYKVAAPGRLYSFGTGHGNVSMQQYADMVNGSYYMVSRIGTQAALLGQTTQQVQRKLDSVLYENIPGKILLKKTISKNGYRGYDITNRTRRGDLQRYQIFITPFEIILFKISGNGDYVTLGTEASQFFNSIQLKEGKTEWKKWSPRYGGFEVAFPSEPLQTQTDNHQYSAYDGTTKTAYSVIRTDLHNYQFLEEDSFDLRLMEESFSSSDCIDTCTSRLWTTVDGFKALDARYRYKDSSVAFARFLIKGPHYYTLVTTSKSEHKGMSGFIKSFSLKPFTYGQAKKQSDTSLRFNAWSPVPLQKEAKLSMYPEENFRQGSQGEDSLVNNGIYLSRLVEDDSTGERILVTYYRQSPYYFRPDNERSEDSAAFYKEWTLRSRKTDSLKNGMVVTEYELGSAKSSRMLKGKFIGKDGMGYKIETQTDTLSGPGVFVRSFFQTFQPLDSLQDLDVRSRKSAFFFRQLFSTDTLERKKALKNVGSVEMEDADLPALQRAISSLSWSDKGYLATKKEFIGKLSTLQQPQAADYLKATYENASDTLELQYAALEALLGQQTAYAYQTFAGIMQTDPPVLDLNSIRGSYNVPVGRRRWQEGAGYKKPGDGSFFTNLADSLPLTAGIVKSLMPLLTVNDYEQPILQLMGSLADSNLLRPKDYEAYLPKFILEAKQLLKKQLIQEKAKAIERAVKKEENNETGMLENDDADRGNNQLSLYATLLLPYWEQNNQVPQIMQQLLQSGDKRLQYTTARLLLRNNRPVPDTILHSLAALDEFRYELYAELSRLKKEHRFPAAFASQQSMAKSRLVSYRQYGRPDSLVYLHRVPVTDNGAEGIIYFFKYQEKKDDNTWKLAVAGLFPIDSTRLLVTGKEEDDEEKEWSSFSGTKLTDDQPLAAQLEKFTRRLLTSRRKSGAYFYGDDNQYGYY